MMVVEKKLQQRCRKIAEAKIKNKKEIEVWEMENKQDLLYIDDCLSGSLAVFESNKIGPYNVGMIMFQLIK